MGDLNLDFFKWGSSTGLRAKLISEINNITPEGSVQLVKGATWHQQHRRPTCIDHIWTNSPNRIASVQNLNDARSDHNIIISRVKKLGVCSTFQWQTGGLGQVQEP